MPIINNKIHSNITLQNSDSNPNKVFKTDHFIEGLWDYYQGIYKKDHQFLSAVQNSHFSEPLYRIKKYVNQEELYPDCDSILTYLKIILLFQKSLLMDKWLMP